MNSKNIIIGCAIILSLIIVGFAFRLSGSTLITSTSPNRKYKIDIKQSRDASGVERSVYLNAYRSGELFVQNKLIYTGDILDDNFMDLYSNISWPSENTLKIGRKLFETPTNNVSITNESGATLNYVLLETYGDKYVVFDILPRTVINLKFEFLGQLSCQGEFAESKKRFGNAVRLVDDGEGVVHGEFTIKVKEKDVLIKSENIELKQVGCCAVDRPDMKHEKF